MNKIFFLGMVSLFFCCKNNININDNYWKNNNTYIIEKTNKNYVLNQDLIIPKKCTLIIKNGVNINIKSGNILNNGCFFIGDNTDSLNININSSKSNIYNNSKTHLNINNTFLKNINIINKNSDLFITNSNFNNCNLKISDSKFVSDDCYFNKNIININNSYVLFKNSILKTNEPIYLKNNKNISLNNCLFYHSNEGFIFNKNKKIHIINSVFFYNKSVFIMNNKNVYGNFFNNLFIKNDVVFETKDSSQFYFINNIFHENETVFKAFFDRKIKKSIISKNNIYYNNYKNFQVKNINISNSYNICNNDSLMGYYNIYQDPLFIDPENFNYNFLKKSPALRSGTNNTNIGTNINNINIIKYLYK